MSKQSFVSKGNQNLETDQTNQGVPPQDSIGRATWLNQHHDGTGGIPVVKPPGWRNDDIDL